MGSTPNPATNQQGINMEWSYVWYTLGGLAVVGISYIGYKAYLLYQTVCQIKSFVKQMKKHTVG